MLLPLLALLLAAADPPPRSPFFAGLSLGAGAGGWTLDGRQTAWSGLPGITSPFAAGLVLRGGLTLTPRLLAGLELLGVGSWGGSSVPLEFGAFTTERRAAVNHFGLSATFFPLARGPFLRLGAGLAEAFEEFHQPAREEVVRRFGFGLTGAGGWAFLVAEHVAISVELAGALGLYGDAPGLPGRSLAATALVGLEWQ